MRTIRLRERVWGELFYLAVWRATGVFWGRAKNPRRPRVRGTRKGGGHGVALPWNLRRASGEVALIPFKNDELKKKKKKKKRVHSTHGKTKIVWEGKGKRILGVAVKDP